MISFRPDHIVADSIRTVRSCRPTNLLPLYEYFARKATAMHPGHLECMNNTSSINNSEFAGLDSMMAVQCELAGLFASVGTASHCGRFLAECGIRNWADLARPIVTSGWDRPFRFPASVRERKLRQSWNSCHPDAMYGQTMYLRFCADGQWSAMVAYGYSHDSSRWYISLDQGRDALSTFLNKIEPWVESLFEQETPRERQRRQHANQVYDATRRAVSSVFYAELSGRDESLADILSVDGTSMTTRRITLDTRRLGVLRRWIQADRATRNSEDVL